MTNHFKLENGNIYEQVDSIDYNGKIYLFLINIKDEDDEAIRITDGKFLKGLETNEEFDKVYDLFMEKNKPDNV